MIVVRYRKRRDILRQCPVLGGKDVVSHIMLLKNNEMCHLVVNKCCVVRWRFLLRRFFPDTQHALANRWCETKRSGNEFRLLCRGNEPLNPRIAIAE